MCIKERGEYLNFKRVSGCVHVLSVCVATSVFLKVKEEEERERETYKEMAQQRNTLSRGGME